MTTHLFDILAEVTAREKPSACFALLGDANMNWGTVLAGLGVPMIYTRHEHCAVAAAMAHARKTGEVGLATVTCGPGSMAQGHKPDEFVSVEQMRRCDAMLDALLLHLRGG